MPPFLFKSFLSLVMIPTALIALFTMFEIFGRERPRLSVASLKALHRVNGVIYLIIFFYLTYHCLSFVMATKGEPSSRATFHSLFSLLIIVLFSVKVSFIKAYRQFYAQARTLGLVMALATFGMVGTSGIYYLLVTDFGTQATPSTTTHAPGALEPEGVSPQNALPKIDVRTNPGSITRGKILFKKNCSFCHDPTSTAGGPGPGLKGVLSRPTLPVSNKASTPETIAEQLRAPVKDMPAFTHLDEDEVADIISFLNTL